MKISHTILAILSAVALCAAYSALRAQNSTLVSVWDGIYTDEQAKRGEPLYKDHCLDCHGEELEGDAEAPPLSGGTFLTNWDGLPLGNLYLRIRRDMPLNREAGTLSPAINADVLAYILSVNHFPSGHAELPHAAEVLNQIKFEAEKPKARR